MSNRGAAFAYAITALLAACGGESVVVPSPAPAQETPMRSNYDGSWFSGGDGLTKETAVVVGTASRPGGIPLEYSWLREHYPSFKLLSQRLAGPLDREQGQSYDILNIQTADGRTFDIWFDITSFFE